MQVYLAVIRNSFLNMLAYRMRYVTGILTYLLFVGVQYFIWQAVYANSGSGAKINGFTLSEMLTYVAIAWLARSLYFSGIDEEIEDLVRSGQISVYLMRPISFQLMMFFQALGESIFRAAFFTWPIAIVIFLIFPVSLPVGALGFLLFCLSTFSGFLVLVLLNFIVGMLAFEFKSTQGIMQAKYYLIQLFSGLLLPISFFPKWLQTISDYLPFKIISYVPLQFYLGKVSSEQVLSILFNQLIWIVTLIVIGQLMWQWAIRKLTLQGG